MQILLLLHSLFLYLQLLLWFFQAIIPSYYRLLLNATGLSALHKLSDLIKHLFKNNLPKFSVSKWQNKTQSQMSNYKANALDSTLKYPYLGFGKHSTSPEFEHFHTALHFLPPCPCLPDHTPFITQC